MNLLFIGSALTATSWYFAWSRLQFFTEYSFFPLWIGYIITINGISEFAFGDSLVRRMRSEFLILFAASVPFWWFFEYVNRTVQSWHYVFPHDVSRLHFAIQASIDFSTVIPAVMSTTLLFYLIFEKRRLRWQGEHFSMRRRWLALMILLGFISSLLLALLPHLTFPLVWIAPILVIEPFMFALGYPSLLRKIQNGEWRVPVSVMTATLFTGFWWEFWNAYSSPKWVYTIPYLGFWKIFEMPFLGYFGYPFFGLIIYSYTMFILTGLMGNERTKELICGAHAVE